MKREMENGHGGGKLADNLSGLRVNDDDNETNDSLFQVMKAVEAAEATIKQQVEENNRLRTELQLKIQLLEKYKLEEKVAQRPDADPNQSLQRPHHDSVSYPQRSTSDADPSGRLLLHQDPKPNINGTFNQPHPETTAPSHLSSPSTTSFSPTRHHIDGEYDPRAHGLMPMTELNNPTTLWKQDLVAKIREHEEEILQLRKHLTEYSIKEAQIRNEKYVLEKRIAYMRLAFDQQQQDLVDAASKALSYRQDIIEENIHLTYQLQAAQQERSTFVQSLLPLLAEYSLQPPVPDAQSIVSNVKVLFKHLQEKLILTESKLKESQYQLAPWRSDSNHSTVALQSPSHSTGAALDTSNKNGLELVPQPTYPHGKLSTTSDAQVATSWEFLGQYQGAFGGVIGKNLDDDMRRYSPLASRNSASQDIPAQFASIQDDVHAMQYGDETANKQVKFFVPVNKSEMDDPDAEEHQNERDHSSNWTTGNPAYNTNLDDPNSSYSPYLPPVLEEPTSSFSEAADDDALPAIEGLQILGDAFPGRQLLACGYSINGTTSCNFEWVRHLEDGSVNYIEGAKQPTYLVTADDVDSYLAIEVQPLDDRKRKGGLVKVFANDHGKITCGPEMENCIEKTLSSGHASYKVSLSTVYSGIWEPATLAVKREGYSIKCGGISGAVITEKFSPSITVSIPYANPTEFLIIGSGGDEHHLRADATDVSSRDTIVLTLRLFIIKAVERRKGKKRSIFFHK